MQDRDATIFNIQALRAFAALSVVFLHLSEPAGLGLPFAAGRFGVDIFFVISGFIISYVAARDPSDFMVKRLIRIVPAYWAATLLLFALVIALPHLFHTAKPDPQLLGLSLAFLPSAPGVNPILAVGWSLNYEMYFYVLFALSLAVSRRHAGAICAALILAIMAIVHLWVPSGTVLRFYGRPVVLEFVFGIALFEAWRLMPRTASVAPRRGALVAGAMLLAALAVLLAGGLPIATLGRASVLGVPAAAIVGSALLLEGRYRLALTNSVVLLLGEASYVLYLIHDFVIYGFTRLVFRGSPHWPIAAKLALFVPAIAIAAAIAVALHLWIEKPVLAALRRRFIGAQPAAPTLAAAESNMTTHPP